MSEKEEKSKKNPIASVIIAIPVIWIANAFFPGVIPFETFAFWESKGELNNWLYAGRWLFLWGLGIQTILQIFKNRSPFRGDLFSEMTPGGVFKMGLLVSFLAGVLEEIAFRWLIFLAAIATVQLTNFLFFGFAGFGIAEWMHLNVFGPIADWASLGLVHELLFHPAGWAVGAAVLYANAFFRDDHLYQGFFGAVNSWFAGLYFFWLLFTHGLLAAIIVHFLYDVIVFTVIALSFAIQNVPRRRGLPF